MNLPILQEKIIIRPDDLEALCPDFQVLGVFNPGAVRFGDEIILLVRVAEFPPCQDEACLHSPRGVWGQDELCWVVDSFDPAGVDTSDPRKFFLPDGRMRLRFISHLRLARLSKDGTHLKEITVLPDLLPQEPWEEFGIEDARISKIGDTYYITYVAVSRQRGVATALMSTQDFQHFQRHGIIFPTENKDVVLLPEKWGDSFVAYHRPVSEQAVNAPSIETALSKDLAYWGKFDFLFGPRPNTWDSLKIVAGPPPVRIPQGWLFLYHGVTPPTPQSPAGRYCVGASLLDADNPLDVIARSAAPMLCPDRPHEKDGYVPNVIFPTGSVLSEDHKNLLIFSGGADEVTTLLTIPVQSILDHLAFRKGNI